MKLYSYKNNGEFVTEFSARENPLQKGDFLRPANSTDIRPPLTGDNEVAIFNCVSWSIVADHRGAQGYDAQGVLHEISEIGAIPYPTWTAEFIPPPPRPAEQLAATDAGMIRMMEDLTDLLITKGVITESELPQAAQDKLNNRKALRAQL